MEKHPGKMAGIAAFLLYNLLIYVSRASFSLRPGNEERLIPIMTCFFGSMILGGWAMPALHRFAARGESESIFLRAVHYLPLFLVMAMPVAASLFGYESWLTYEPLRLAFSAATGLLMASANYALYAYGDVRRRGLWMGVGCGFGMLVWRLLVFYAAGYDGEARYGFHPGLYPIFLVSTVVAVVFMASLLRTPYPGNRPAPLPAPYFRAMPAEGNRRRIVLILLASLSLCLLNGVLEAKLFPALLLPPSRMWVALPILLAVFMPLFGWLLDRDPDYWLPRILRGWAYFFLLAPTLAATGEDSPLYTALHAICSIGQVALLVVMTTALAGLAKNAVQAAALANLVFGMRVAALYWAGMLKALPSLGPGLSVLLATVTALIYYQLAVRVVPLPQSGFPAPLPEPIPAPPTTEERVAAARERFLHSVGLTPRERDIARCILEGLSSRSAAAELGISENTVNSHIKKILEKYGTNSRRAFLVLYANAISGNGMDNDAKQEKLP